MYIYTYTYIYIYCRYIYKTHSLKRTDAGGNGLWQGWHTYNWDWQKIDHDGKKCFRNPFFFLESDIKIVYIYNYIYSLFGWVSEEHISKQLLVHHG